ncbi:hypothetical protein SCUCBS95973_009275 [Sporothrix curviconia]|uniref:Uncharacterized protein n=1 Tax=Sporothrix curviconia TaxID=1260050 RepID=A0ABP0CV66_9PEZI
MPASMPASIPIDVPMPTGVDCRLCFLDFRPHFETAEAEDSYNVYQRRARIARLYHYMDHYRWLQRQPGRLMDYRVQVQNLWFLVRFYQGGGSPPPLRTTRWVSGGQFVEMEEVPTGEVALEFTVDTCCDVEAIWHHFICRIGRNGFYIM